MKLRSVRRVSAPVLGALALSILLLMPSTSWPAPPQWRNATAGITNGSNTCTPGGSSSAGSCYGWSGTVKTMPGTICTMNIGNNSPFADYTNKIRNCSEADGRKQGLGGTNCDVINIIEINTDAQCQCACDPSNTCTLVIDPSTGASVCLDDPGRPVQCAQDGFGYYEPARCALCKGCGANKPPTCQTQAEYLCDPNVYDIEIHQVPNKGCDAMCVKRDPCVRPPRCEDFVATGLGGSDPDCDAGNYAICRKCDYDGDDRMDVGSCEAHPPHCAGAFSNDLFHFDLLDPINALIREKLQACLRKCSTPVMEEAARFLSDARVRTISGDLNCDPDRCHWFGQCPWVDLMSSYGLEICNHSGSTTGFGCAVDLVLSNSCGCAQEETREPSPGDHKTIVFNTAAGVWSGPVMEILSANSASSCPDPDQSSSTSDSLGAVASCPTSENGQPVGACSSWGHVPSAKARYYRIADTCDRPELGVPQVLVCETATASAWASCTPNASSGSSAFATTGKATSSQGATCVNGVPYNPQQRVVKTADFVTPGLVMRADGNLYYVVERDAHSDRGSQCNAPVPQPCQPNPVQPVTGAAMAAPFCAASAVNEQ